MQATKSINIFEELPVRTLDVTLPSGFLVTIREQTGEDEDILSNPEAFGKGDSLPKFISNIIVSKKSDGTPYTSQDILNWKIKDKWYILFKSRIFSLGNELEFEHKFADKSKQTIKVDLNDFDWDFSTGLPPAKGEDGYNPQRISPYPSNEKSFEFTTSSKKRIKLDYLTGVGEKFALGLPESRLSINTRLVIRNFQLMDHKGNWHKIERFHMLTSREMAEIRGQIDKYDTAFELQMTVGEGNRAETISLFSVPDFLFPQGW